MKTKFSFLLLLLLTLTFTASAQNTIQSGFTHNNLARNYRLYVPAIYNGSKPVPLILNLHGYGSNFLEQEQYADFRPIADTANFLVVHPNGTVDFQNKRTWNSFGISNVDDLGFLSALIDTISAHYNIDPNQIYSTGMSNGGFMTYDLACFRSNRIAAVASVTGTMIVQRKNTCSPTRPIPVMHIHGTADGTVPYGGNFAFLPVDTVVHYWVRHNNANPTPTITPVPNINTADNTTAEHHVFSGGNLGSVVEFYKVIGGGHSWPGAPVNINVTNMDFSASKEIWRFFRKYRLNMFTTGIKAQNVEVPEISVYPNPARKHVTISFPDFSAKTVTVSDYLGRTVLELQTNEKQEEIILRKKGIYLVTIRQENKTYTKKLINL